ncbi:GspH/FimT family pseudopilin [Xanthomonas translucens pv. phlei]|nr:GspH/FimT family pseudopilin [Xanthomonas translucens pv. phlei]
MIQTPAGVLQRGAHACVPPPRARMRGVSLLEMLLVVGLIAIAAVLAASVLTGGIDGMRLRSSAKEIAAQLRYTRAQAIASGQPQRFLIDPQAHRWQAPNGRHGEIPASLAIRFSGAREAQRREDEGAIKFFEDGAATGGRIELLTRKASWRIDVAWLTGEVKVGRPPQQGMP